jgi:hypothetical protein
MYAFGLPTYERNASLIPEEQKLTRSWVKGMQAAMLEAYTEGLPSLLLRQYMGAINPSCPSTDIASYSPPNESLAQSISGFTGIFITALCTMAIAVCCVLPLERCAWRLRGSSWLVFKLAVMLGWHRRDPGEENPAHTEATAKRRTAYGGDVNYSGKRQISAAAVEEEGMDADVVRAVDDDGGMNSVTSPSAVTTGVETRGVVGGKMSAAASQSVEVARGAGRKGATVAPAPATDGVFSGTNPMISEHGPSSASNVVFPK